MEESNQEYYHSSAGYCKIFASVEGKEDLVIVKNNEGYDGDLVVVDRKGLIKKEDSYEYRMREKQKEELEAVTAYVKKNMQKLSTKLVDAALKDLGTRIRLNAMFGEPANASFALTVVAELEKMIKDKEKLKKVIKDHKEDPFA